MATKKEVKSAENYFTKRPYTGNNALALTGYKDNRWATYKQWFEGDYQVRKGEKGKQITVVVEDKEDPKKTAIRHYWVFNFEQADKIESEAK